MPIFMNYAGITGDVQSTGSHTNWIEISSFSWGVGRGIGSPTGGSADREGSTPSVGEIVVTKSNDIASPGLFQHWLAGNRLLLSIILTSTPKPGGPHHKFNLENAVITDIQPNPRGGGEKVTIAFSQYDFNGTKNMPIPYAILHP